MVHATSNSVSSSQHGGNSQIPPYHSGKPWSSRSNSFSSASVVTITRPGSISSQVPAANGKAPIGVQSPSDTSLLALRISSNASHMNDQHKRRKSVAVDHSEYGNAEAGLDNLNRWSQSTTSSSNTRRSRASSGAVLASLAQQQISPRHTRINRLDASPRASLNRSAYNVQDAGSTPVASPERDRRPLRLNDRTDVRPSASHMLPPLRTAPSAPESGGIGLPSTVSAETPTASTNGLSSTQSASASAYGDPNLTSSPQQSKRDRPAIGRMQTAPAAEMQQLRHTNTQDMVQARHKSRNSTILDSGSRPTTDSSDADSRRRKTRDTMEKEKKAMLSRALQKANTAVLLDNAQNFEGALAAYSDACRLLHMVMERTNGEDDKLKLSAIKKTYTKRIKELRRIEEATPASSSNEDQKDLPTRPMSDDSIVSKAASRVSMIDSQLQESQTGQQEQAGRSTRPATRDLLSDRDALPAQDFEQAASQSVSNSRHSAAPRLSYSRKDRDSFFASTIAAVNDTSRRNFDIRQPTDGRAVVSHDEAETQPGAESAFRFKAQDLYLPPLAQDSFAPAPLSPRRPPGPARQPPDPPVQANIVDRNIQASHAEGQLDGLQGEEFVESNGSVSWLNTIDESGSDCSVTESVHSRDVEHGMRRKQIRRNSIGSNPEFDAAFDAAVEAAYNEGYEPDTDALEKRATAILEERRSVVQSPASVQEILTPVTSSIKDHRSNSTLDDEEEERLLDDITQDYARTFNFEMGMKSALPRQSDSSSYTRSTRSTWQSSQLSDRHTANTSLSTVGEESLGARLAQKPIGTPSSVHTVIAEQPPVLESLPPPAPPPTMALPRPPSLSRRRASSINSEKRASTVRSRRLSGQATKPLLIETAQPETRKRASTFHHHNKVSPFMEETDVAVPTLEPDAKFGASLEPSQSDKMHEHILQSPPSLELRPQTSHASGSTPTGFFTETRRSQDGSYGNLLSARPNLYGKNNSSLSLRDQHTLLSSPDDSLPSAMTPLSSSYLSFSRQHSRDVLSAQQRPQYSTFGSSNHGVSQGLLGTLFDTSISDAHNPSKSPRSPDLSSLPVRLEPCPESFLLRPFWLLRTVSQTIVHPRGGFITTQLFVPREVWQTHNVKLKAEEEKIAQCDLLTAALGRLSNVDSYDADALAEELQNFEGIMERMQAALVKKLGSEVGVHSVSGIFKEAATATPGSAASQDSSTAGDRTSAKAKESRSFSWRKLRSKSSGAPLAIGSSSAVGAGSKVSQRDTTGMPSVPMTSFMPVERRGGKKDVRNMTFEGPHKEYMGSLARLCESAQVLDQIARQVEDPGLKHSSPAHVGLELSIRHAAEFFGFFVCRFVLADLGVLLDKFVKRGTEWVLA